MRKVVHGVVWFSDPQDQDRVLALMKDFCSAKRSAYQAIQRGITGNDIRKTVKKNYSHLGQRFVADAVLEASKTTQPNAIFGGKKAWKDFQTGKISKEEWQFIRNNTLYSRGDQGLYRGGNPNIRIVGEELWINDPLTRGKWIRGKLWLDKPIDLACYDARVQFKKGKFKVTISWERELPPILTYRGRGAIGVDINPDGIALTEINRDGCVVSHQYLQADRIQFARSDKRSYDVHQLAIQAVDLAFQAKKPLILELLKFKNKKNKFKKFNRMRHNFLHAQMNEALKSRAAKLGVEIIEVNPAYTSIIGVLKYMDHYSLNRHTAAALVIARLGLNIRDTVRVEAKESGKSRVNLEGRSRQIALTKKSFSWMHRLFNVRPKPPGVTPPCLDAGLTGDYISQIGHRALVQSTGCRVSGSITGQTRHPPERQVLAVDERPPREVLPTF